MTNNEVRELIAHLSDLIDYHNEFGLNNHARALQSAIDLIAKAYSNPKPLTIDDALQSLKEPPAQPFELGDEVLFLIKGIVSEKAIDGQVVGYPIGVSDIDRYLEYFTEDGKMSKYNATRQLFNLSKNQPK